MKTKVSQKIDKINTVLASNLGGFSEVFYVTSIPGSPAHIKYRYYAKMGQSGVEKIGLECVTEIDGEYVNFKDIFLVNSDSLKSAHPSILDHVELFLNLVALKPKELVVR